MLAPVAFAAFVALTDRYDHGVPGVRAPSASVCLPLLYGIDRGAKSPAG